MLLIAFLSLFRKFESSNFLCIALKALRSLSGVNMDDMELKNRSKGASQPSVQEAPEKYEGDNTLEGRRSATGLLVGTICYLIGLWSD